MWKFSPFTTKKQTWGLKVDTQTEGLGIYVCLDLICATQIIQTETVWHFLDPEKIKLDAQCTQKKHGTFIPFESFPSTPCCQGTFTLLMRSDLNLLRSLAYTKSMIDRPSWVVGIPTLQGWWRVTWHPWFMNRLQCIELHQEFPHVF